MSVRKLAGLALLVAAVNARADFSTEFFTSESAPAGHYEYTQGGNTPTQLGLWTAAPTFNGPALTSMWVNTSNLPMQVLEIGVSVESAAQLAAQPRLVFSFEADQDTTFSFSSLSILSNSSVIGSAVTQWQVGIVKTGIESEWFSSATVIYDGSYSLLSGETLAFYVQPLAFAQMGGENLAWQQVRLVFSGVEMNYTAIPEPGTVAAILGMAALGLVVWRRRAQA
ncbi:MAG TPA: PEP-CTERM sorting domain-containing protein [Opitutus sp.]|nr:PEP-CTERM sorting domain-containing protein [Opitutus sp.]